MNQPSGPGVGGNSGLIAGLLQQLFSGGKEVAPAASQAGLPDVSNLVRNAGQMQRGVNAALTSDNGPNVADLIRQAGLNQGTMNQAMDAGPLQPKPSPWAQAGGQAADAGTQALIKQLLGEGGGAAPQRPMVPGGMPQTAAGVTKPLEFGAAGGGRPHSPAERLALVMKMMG